MSRSAVIITGPGFQDHDVVYTYYRLLEEGWHVDVATKEAAPVTGKYGVPLPMDKTAAPLISFSDLDVNNYDAVILTGGHEAPDRVRQDQQVLAFVAAMATRARSSRACATGRGSWSARVCSRAVGPAPTSGCGTT